MSRVSSDLLHCVSAHAAIAPWEGKNAMDAAVAAHTNIGLLRQQLKPDNRVHGVFGGRDWATNGMRNIPNLLFILLNSNLTTQSYRTMQQCRKFPRHCPSKEITNLCETLRYYIRSETWAEVLSTVARVENCFE